MIEQTTEEEEDEESPIEVELGNSGLYAWIDEIDRDITINNWGLKSAGTKQFPHYYAYRAWHVNNVRGEYYLHNEVWERMMGFPLPKGFLVDHINGDKLDNRRSNLRLATRSDNEANKKKRRTQSGGPTSSKYKGVSKVTDGRKKCWRVTITREKHSTALGAFYSEREAGEAYNKAALEYFGEFAVINEFDDDDE